MFSLRGLFPSFEKPVERQRYLNLEPQRRDFRGIAVVLGLAATCGVALALWEPSTQAATPFADASVTRSSPAQAGNAAIKETTAAAANVEDDQPAPTVKMSTFCSQRTSARRDCASVKAFKDARLKVVEPTPETPVPQAAPAAVKAAVADQEPVSTASAQPSDAPVVQAPQRAAAAPKAKRLRVADDAPVERLVRVYDRILPDGRRVPVYRRVGGGYETGIIIDGEYRRARRAHLEPPSGARVFGLQ